MRSRAGMVDARGVPQSGCRRHATIVHHRKARHLHEKPGWFLRYRGAARVSVASCGGAPDVSAERQPQRRWSAERKAQIVRESFRRSTGARPT
ncbi:MAG: hypothetical protein OXF79_04535 [Chloroflexi bacterium]|nr:hypothetical protein [Chloroflexota bacterium]